jgi:preprotein translocase subunit SecA
MIERLVLLRTIDSLWVEHLTELDDMRRGIGLRGYAQQDPLNEFRREAFALYTELRDLIRHQLAGSIFRVTVTRQPAPGGDDGPRGRANRDGAGPTGDGPDTDGDGPTNGEGPKGDGQPRAVAAGPVARGLPTGPNVRGVRESLGDEVVAGGAAAGGAAGALRPGFTPSGDRIGRNDICFCGSGLKYKRCHGR